MTDPEAAGGPPGQPPRQHAGKRISLVLGSGGARGYAHIGVIEELQARGFEIASIAGSSMGALIGGIHAAGRLQAYREWAERLQRVDVLRLLDWTLSGGGFIKGNRIIDVLRELVGDVRIEDLPIPYTAVAVDIEAQREIWFSDGPLFDAVRASIAIPTVLRPHHYQGRLLVDGGLLNPLPVSPVLRDHNDYIVAVTVNAEPEPRFDAAGGDARKDAPEDHPGLLERLLPSRASSAAETPSPGHAQRLAHFLASLHPGNRTRPPEAHDEMGLFDLFSRSLDTVQETITRLKLAAQPPDLLIRIPRNACAFYEFHRAADLVTLGHERTVEALARWEPGPSAERSG